MILVHERRSVAGSWFANDGVKTVKMVKIVKSGVHAEWLMVDGGSGRLSAVGCRRSAVGRQLDHRQPRKEFGVKLCVEWEFEASVE